MVNFGFLLLSLGASTVVGESSTRLRELGIMDKSSGLMAGLSCCSTGIMDVVGVNSMEAVVGIANVYWIGLQAAKHDLSYSSAL